ncbi:hypothetical protein [uncultured Rhodoferax sp.]|uniref:hypothetical protein n=1 Tax=uncultured Rhodoferax sp. TaxID=223188 RepID=UPI0025F25AB3|nr:hypothetical protein [uncultured Rhodoferax sp.]
MKKVLLPLATLLLIACAGFYWLSDTCDTSVCQLAEVMPIVGGLQDENASIKQDHERVIPSGANFHIAYADLNGRFIFVLKNNSILLVERQLQATNQTAVWRCELIPKAQSAKALLDDCGKKFRLHSP